MAGGTDLAVLCVLCCYTGTTMFSFSIFGLVLARERVGPVFGPMTPIGGMLMICESLRLEYANSS